MARLQIEHIIPHATFSAGDPLADDEMNLWLACPLCNAHKSNKTTATDPKTEAVVALFNPRMDVWSEHFEWSPDGLRIVGRTVIGRATVAALHLDDDPDALTVRANWVAAGWHPPED
jgi:hypothetical protein